jgi:hypothetical protein
MNILNLDYAYRLFCHSGLDPESIAFFRLICHWMPDRACPQLDWGSGMTSRNEALP